MKIEKAMNIKNMRFLNSLAFLCVLTISFTACNTDDKDDLDGKGPNILRADAGPDKLFVATSTTSSGTLATIHKDANSAAGLNVPVSATFTVDASIVTAHNAANPGGIQYAAMDPQYFSFSPASLDFGAGETQKDLGIVMKANGLDLSKDYAIGLVITANGYTGGGDKFIKIALPSAYEGDYTSIGERYNFAQAADANSTTWPPTGQVSVATWNYTSTTASTLSSKTVAVHAANSNGGFGRINLTVDPATNKVTIVPNDDIALNALVQSTHRPSTYDPATKTFELYYQYTNLPDANGVSSFRMLHHKLKHN
ncbi:hypothetical protein WSM22_19650 [Cytophagales bacterium WSM2-2]|nr:hypothetical protein WSM22_19650 [Cytophagales bacterium WSM2-2]